MSQDQPTDWINTYRDDGIVFPLRAMSEEEANSLRTSLESIAADLCSTTEANSLPLNFRPWLAETHPFCEPLLALAQRDSILGCVEAILGTDVVLRTCDLFFKRKTNETLSPGQARLPLQIQWHWDDPRNLDGSDGMLTVWLALTPSTPINGAVRFVPGSHKVPLERDDPLDRDSFDVKKSDWEAFGDIEPIDAELSPGEFSIHHAAIIHGSTVNGGEMDRCGIALRYASPSTSAEILGAQKVFLVRGAIPASPPGLNAAKNVPIMWWDPDAPIDIEEELRDAEWATDEKWDRPNRLAFQENAEAGDADAQFQLAQICLEGTHEEPDLAAAISWFEAAAAQDHGDALFQLGKLYEKGKGIQSDKERAVEYWKKGAEVGNNDAQYAYAQSLARGRGIARDAEAAGHWFKTAAEQGHGRAQVAWGQALTRGQGVKRNREAGFSWLLKAAEKDMSSAQAAVGIMLRHGKVTGKNTAEALRWLQRAAQSGHPRAQLHLGQMLLTGESGEMDPNQAAEWFRKALDNGIEDAEMWLEKCEKSLKNSEDASP